ncbi:MAG: ankyrin repeat domain-containing protein [Wolbachia endosymbiont of Alcedoecus sp.]|nr:ankyrin repeat domain-containing protein [Wolbachia endosymbiont of Alcedoecus sp.]
MKYSDDDIRELRLDIDRIIGGDKVASLEDLQKRLKRKAKFKEVNLQGECEGGNSLGDLLLKYAAEEDNLRVKNFLLKNGFTLPQAAVTNEEEKQNTPDVEENKADSNEVDSSTFINPGMTAEVLYEQLIQGRETNRAIFDSFANAVRESNITGDRGIFLDVIKLFTDLDAVIHLTDTASRTILGIAAITKQADIIEVLLDSDKFSEEEKFDALHLAITQGNIQEVKPFLGRISDETMQAALRTAIDNVQEEITEMLLNLITPETPNVNENDPTNTSSNNRRTNSLTNHQFSLPNEKETKYKENKENFHISLRNDVVGVVITGLFIAAAVMVPSVAGAVICGIVAALALVATVIHVKDSTLPSYKEMREVELTKQKLPVSRHNAEI